jgi:hypothetical protein
MVTTAEQLTAERTAEDLWWARLDRAQSEDQDQRLEPAAAQLWHLMLCVLGELPAAGFTPNRRDPRHQERERCRVLSELGELYGIGPFPRPSSHAV